MAHPVSTGSPAGGPGEDGEEEHGGEIVVVDETAEEQKERQCRGRPPERPGKGRPGNHATDAEGEGGKRPQDLQDRERKVGARAGNDLQQEPDLPETVALDRIAVRVTSSGERDGRRPVGP